jgi:ribosomal protein S18 acetylase RimI-like enzyme
MDIDISIMTPGDFDFTLRMTDIEKWGYLRSDFDRHVQFEPEGCFVARSDNNYVGMITTTSYDHFGFIGGLIVPEQYRGYGIGAELMQVGMDYLKQKGVSTSELDGVFPAVPLYRRLGFRDKYLSLRFFRNPKEIKTGNISPSDFSIEKIIDFDRQKTGLDRSRLLKGFFEQIPDSLFVNRQPDSFGYAIVKPCAGNFSMIGPMVCDNIKNAENLLKAIIDKYDDRTIVIGVPEMKIDFVDILIRHGFDYSLPSLRMSLGKSIDYEKSVYAILSPGQG